MRFRHPRTAALQQWLSGAVDDDVEKHVGTCQHCATVLEELDAREEVTIGHALAEALAPPEDLTERLVAGVNAKLSSRQVVGVVADLFGAGIETTRLLLIEDTDDNN
ncbi:MAG: hypothetical protein GY724_20730 [Actinomycetia bacterium]|nr:hypothetical protein [Actinomycetes bacterium]